MIYLKVDVSHVYRLDLSTPTTQLQYPDVHLFNNHLEPSGWICDPIDFDLRVQDEHGMFTEPLIVKSITRLTPEQVEAIPAKFRP